MRKKIVAGNWKLNKSLEESIQLAKEVSAIVDAEGNDGVDVVVVVGVVVEVVFRSSGGGGRGEVIILIRGRASYNSN